MLHFISGDFGPLVPGMPCQLPLWLALTLRKKGKCRIEIPDWMSIQSLETYISQERRDTRFSSVPFHYVEIAQLLLNYARDDFTSIDRVSALIADLENIRMDRIRVGIAAIATQVKSGQAVVSIGLTNISCAEIQAIKPVFIESMRTFKQLTDLSQDENGGGYNSAGRLDDSYQTQTPQATSNLRRFKRDT